MPRIWAYAAVDEMVEEHGVELNQNEYEGAARVADVTGTSLFKGTLFYDALVQGNMHAASEQIRRLVKFAMDAETRARFKAASRIFDAPVFAEPYPDDEPAPEPAPDEPDNFPVAIAVIIAMAVIAAGLAFTL